MKFEAHLLWATPLYLTTDTNLDNDKIVKYIYNEQKADPDGRVLSNDQDGWQSKLLDPNNEILKPLSDTIYKLCLGINLGIEKIRYLKYGQTLILLIVLMCLINTALIKYQALTMYKRQKIVET
jgi:hypothetical protein